MENNIMTLKKTKNELFRMKLEKENKLLGIGFYPSNNGKIQFFLIMDNNGNLKYIKYNSVNYEFFYNKRKDDKKQNIDSGVFLFDYFYYDDEYQSLLDLYEEERKAEAKKYVKTNYERISEYLKGKGYIDLSDILKINDREYLRKYIIQYGKDNKNNILH